MNSHIVTFIRHIRSVSGRGTRRFTIFFVTKSSKSSQRGGKESPLNTKVYSCCTLRREPKLPRSKDPLRVSRQMEPFTTSVTDFYERKRYRICVRSVQSTHDCFLVFLPSYSHKQPEGLSTAWPYYIKCPRNSEKSHQDLYKIQTQRTTEILIVLFCIEVNKVFTVHSHISVIIDICKPVFFCLKGPVR